MNTHIFELADRLKLLQDEKKDREADLKEITTQIDLLDHELSDAMAEEEVDRFCRNGSTFYLKSRLFASPKAGMKEDLIEVLEENGYGSLISRTVNSNTLSAFVKEHREMTGEEMPDWLEDIIIVYEKISVGIRKN